MLSNLLLRKTVSYLLFNDVAKLCFGTAAGFAIVGSAGIIANHFVPGTTRLNVLTWISVFYLLLGFLEPLRANRFANKKTRTAQESDCCRDDRVDYAQASRAA
jgi:hypothetical protein